MNAQRLHSAEIDAANWLSHGRTYSEQRFSPLAQIDAANVGDLKLAWHQDLDAAPYSQQATPLVIDGVMYVTTSWSKVYALDAQSGALLWQFDPKVPGEWNINACCDPANRGVAAWEGRLYLGALDGRLIALNAATGKVEWEVLTVDRAYPYTIVGAPRVINGKVIIGNAGGEFGARGYVSAYDANTGRQIWRFYSGVSDRDTPPVGRTLTGDAKTSSVARLSMGGGSVSDAMAYDAKLDLLYLGTGPRAGSDPGAAASNTTERHYTSSIIALRPDNGEYVWHFETAPGSDLGYGATTSLILADLPTNGSTPKPVILQASESGVFYVIDRVSGQFITAQPYAPLDRASGFDTWTGHPLPNRDDSERGKPAIAQPDQLGAHAWQSMAFSPLTGLAYIPVVESRSSTSGTGASGVNYPKLTGRLAAWDPANQKEVWRVESSAPWNGGIVATAGNLVFQGTAMGQLIAYEARRGTPRWSASTQAGIVAAPITYSVDGEQYVAVLTGWGGAFANSAGELARNQHAPINTPRVLAYSLKGRDTLPRTPEVDRFMAVPPPLSANPKAINRGRLSYVKHCSRCHGNDAVSGSFIPDLRNSPALANATLWQKVVFAGELRERGMVGFSTELDRTEVEDVRSYVIARAHDARRPVLATPDSPAR